MNTNPFAMRPNRRRRPPDGGVPRPAHWFSFVGAGALIAVGYIDPGNWATALAAGAGYGYQLLGMVLLASVMAMLLQWLSSRLGVVTGLDLAQICRERTGRRTNLFLWLTSEIAIIACDVAEVVGSAVALQLLLGVSLTVGVLMSAVCTFALLALQRKGGRKLEAVIAALIGFVGLCFVVQLALARPDWHAALAGTAPSVEMLRNAGMVWLAAGIVGATVMPHNLYLHSALVKHHAPHGSDAEIKAALQVVNLDTFGSLTFAFVINAALLIVAAAVFYASGHRDVTDLADAHRLIAPLVGTHWAGILFAAALLACGLSATVTGTLAGQAVMEGFLRLKLPRWQRAAHACAGDRPGALRGRAVRPAWLEPVAGREPGGVEPAIAARGRAVDPLRVGCRADAQLARARRAARAGVAVGRVHRCAERRVVVATGVRRLMPDECDLEMK